MPTCARALLVNLQPSAIRKLGLTYAALRSVNPALVCVALTRYGLESPYAECPAYDYVIQAMTGIMELTGDPAAPPTKTGYSAVDNSAGIMAALGLLAKIVEGRGGQVDVAMYDAMLSQLNYLASASLSAGEPMRRYANSAHPYIVPAQIFPTRDAWRANHVTSLLNRRIGEVPDGLAPQERVHPVGDLYAMVLDRIATDFRFGE